MKKLAPRGQRPLGEAPSESGGSVEMTNRREGHSVEVRREGEKVKVAIPQASKTREADLKELVGKVVDIPAKHFGMDVPEMYYR